MHFWAKYDHSTDALFLGADSLKIGMF